MILKASQRKGGKDLALHLQRGDTNEHVTVHDVRGFISEDMVEAFQEAYALSLGTKCEQYLFSLSLNPPEEESVEVGDFEEAIDKVEKALGLSEQPRVIVFHEKNGRRHCHCVWSRIFHDGEKFKALNMAHYKLKLNAVAKELFLHHGWHLPPGFKNKEDTSPTNYSLHEWQQAERLKDDPVKLKAFFQSCWNGSDSKQSFAGALQERGYYLAKGDRRGYVAVDFEGEVYSLSRWLGVKKKDLKAKLGDYAELPSADQAREFLQSRIQQGMVQLLAEKRAMFKERKKPVVQELRQLVIIQRQEREELLERQRQRWVEETKSRAGRFAKGMTGIWDMMSGKNAEIRQQNEQEAVAAHRRDRAEMEAMVRRHLEESRDLHKTLNFYKDQHREEEWQLKKQVAGHINAATAPEKPKDSQKQLKEQLAALESKIASLSGDIASLQASLDSALLSDDMKAKIRALILRAQETIMAEKVQKKREEIKQQEKADAARLMQIQQELYRSIQSYERLQQLQEEQKRQIAANTAFYARVQHMSYDLNGLPLYPLKVAAPPGEPFNEVRYKETLKRESNTGLVKTVKTAPPKKQHVTTTALKQSTLTVSEVLSRAGKPPRKRTSGQAAKPKVRLAAQFKP
ncbi:MAG: hypothetical protein D8M28_00760 [Proteobacteria bacterium]|nr:hypothetical protein [Pseudomonadota bacterium]